MITMDVEFVANMAELAEASYALFDLNDPSTALISSGFSATQAAEFVTNWSVVHHLPDTDTDFSAILFRSKIDKSVGSGLAFCTQAKQLKSVKYKT